MHDFWVLCNGVYLLCWRPVYVRMYVCMYVCSYCLTLWFCSVRKWLWKGCFLLRKSRPSPWQHCSCTSSHCVVSNTSNRQLPRAYEAASGRGWWREGMEGKGVGQECCMVNYKYSNVWMSNFEFIGGVSISEIALQRCTTYATYRDALL